MKCVTLGTAGHIDHGKTALVRALTGINTDRLPEEKRRGITIDIGFAHLDLTPQLRLAIVNVPGHEAFVRNMAAGASGVDLGLLVVAADKGVMPQTREHLDILALLGVPLAAVALSKSDRVDHEWLELVLADLRDFLDNASASHTPIIATSTITGAGLAELRNALIQSASRITDDRSADLFRLPIDRVFTMTGTGTVVTGTVWSGQLQRDTPVRLIPAGLEGRVRALQCQGTSVASVRSGDRAAVAIAGISVHDVKRGETLVSDLHWSAAQQITVQLQLLPHASHVLRDRQRVHLHLGTAAVTARVRLFRATLEPGNSDPAVLQLERPCATRAGDRFIVRSYSPVTTIAGGMVLEWQPQRYRRRGSDQPNLEKLRHTQAAVRTDAALLLAGLRGMELRHLPLHVIPPSALADHAITIDQRVFHDAFAENISARVLAQLAELHAQFPLRAGVASEMLRSSIAGTIPTPLREYVLNDLLKRGQIRMTAALVALADWKPQDSVRHANLRNTLLERLQREGTSASSVEQLTAQLGQDVPEVLRALADAGLVTRINPSWYLCTVSVAQAQTALAAALSAGPRPAHELKPVLGLTRKHLIPFLEFCDRQGLTTRAGDQRTLTPLKAVSHLGDATR